MREYRETTVNDERDTLKELVARSRDGNQEAFREIFDLLSDRLFAYALSHTKHRDNAADAVQETFIDLWNALSSFEYRSPEAFYGFSFLILKRKIARQHRTARGDLPLNELIVGESYEMEREDYRHLIKHIERLATKYQEVLRLRYWGGMTFGEIAETLRIKETTAKVLHHRALQKLKISIPHNV